MPMSNSAKIVMKKPEEDPLVLERRKRKFNTLSEVEKRLERARRFGISTPQLEEEKKLLRVQRFATDAGTGALAVVARPGSSLNASTCSLADDEVERREKRMKRFGTVSYTEEDRRKMREKRFGDCGASSASLVGARGVEFNGSISEAEKMALRQKRFNLSALDNAKNLSEEKKRRLREERFGNAGD